MRSAIGVIGVVAALALPACSEIKQDEALKQGNRCARELADAPETAKVYQRLWLGDGNDPISKLRDPDPLTPDEKATLTQFQNKLVRCRQIVTAGGGESPTWEAVFRDQYNERSDAIYYRLINNDLPVGLANRLTIESVGKFQADMLRDHPRAVPRQEIVRQQAAEEMLKEAGPFVAVQPPPPPPSKGKLRQAKQTAPPPPAAPTCNWVGNALDCTIVR